MSGCGGQRPVLVGQHREVTERLRGRLWVAKVALPIADDLEVDGDGDRPVAGSLGPPDELLRDGAIAVHVQLEPAWRAGSLRYRRCAVLHRSCRERREAEQPTGVGRGPRHRHLGLGIGESLVGHRRDAHRQRQATAEDLGREVDLRDVDEHPRPQASTLEGGRVLAQGDLVVGAADDVVEGVGSHPFARKRLELAQVDDARDPVGIGRAVGRLGHGPCVSMARCAATRSSARTGSTASAASTNAPAIVRNTVGRPIALPCCSMIEP